MLLLYEVNFRALNYHNHSTFQARMASASTAAKVKLNQIQMNNKMGTIIVVLQIPYGERLLECESTTHAQFYVQY